MDKQRLKEISIAEIVNRNPGSVKIFERFKIDYCCNGKLNFEEACRRASVSEEEVLVQLNDIVSDTLMAPIRPQDWPLDFLANYIVQNHHTYVKKLIPEILFLSGKVSMAHGSRHPELSVIEQQFKVLSEDLEKHMYKEEVVLFPEVAMLVKQSSRKKKIEGIAFRLKYPVEVMESDHENAGQILAKIRELSADYALPPDACNSYSLLYSRLKEFEEDLHLHIHLENNILFPKTLELEARLVTDSACLI